MSAFFNVNRVQFSRTNHSVISKNGDIFKGYIKLEYMLELYIYKVRAAVTFLKYLGRWEFLFYLFIVLRQHEHKIFKYKNKHKQQQTQTRTFTCKQTQILKTEGRDTTTA